MTDYTATLRTMHRPRLLLCAARHGLVDYQRNQHLKRVLKQTELPEPGKAVPQLFQREAEIESLRVSGDATYSAVRHLDTLIALMAEMALQSDNVTSSKVAQLCG
ncbi:DUF6477 family protein [Actibacterium sp. 188UL27-1]|uniref:DUF6477 family protein n=1 Tax=Actibacterium sp. 188UL27-1 TaxID=2786961 RepID=UPI001957771A|nr:DUF6477 family protein [Actibacterium sp. 188UL27-1]MBM7068485.1 hypothetical protein [Actibacterium sp. 188UL27-1]